MNNKVIVLGVGFNPTNYSDLIQHLLAPENRKGYVCFPDLYNIIRANNDCDLFKIYENSTLTLSDGKPSQFFLKKKGFPNSTNISGFWLCHELLKTNLSHYFYGTTDANLIKLKENLCINFPTANILGFKSPPTVAEHEIAENELINYDVNEIYLLNPDIIWIGISSPKQDFLMNYFRKHVSGTIMIGVGAVFDYFAGVAYMGPEWIKKIGLRWLYQLIKDPKRYYKRVGYIFFNLPKIIIKYYLNVKSDDYSNKKFSNRF